MNEIKDLKRFCVLNKKRWFLVPLVMLIFTAVLAGGYYLSKTVFAGDTVYRCKACYYITYDESEDDTVKLYYNAYTWLDVLKTDPLAGEVAKKLNLEKEYVASKINSPGLSDIRFLWVYIDDTDREEAEKIQNAFIGVLDEFGASTDGFESITVWDAPSTGVVKDDFLIGRVAVFGLIAGFASGVLILMYVSAADDRIFILRDTLKYGKAAVIAVLFNDGSSYQTPLFASLKDSGKETVVYDRDGKKDSGFYEKAFEGCKITVCDKESVVKVKDKEVTVLIPVKSGEKGQVLGLYEHEIKTLGITEYYAVITDSDRKLYENYYGRELN